MRCSMTSNTGSWRIIEGGGTLVMTYPEGVVGVETLTGTVYPHGHE
jgi:hypothetical protein